MACIDMKRKAITQKVPTKADLQQEVNVMKKLNEALEDVLKNDEENSFKQVCTRLSSGSTLISLAQASIHKKSLGLNLLE